MVADGSLGPVGIAYRDVPLIREKPELSTSAPVRLSCRTTCAQPQVECSSISYYEAKVGVSRISMASSSILFTNYVFVSKV